MPKRNNDDEELYAAIAAAYSDTAEVEGLDRPQTSETISDDPFGQPDESAHGAEENDAPADSVIAAAVGSASATPTRNPKTRAAASGRSQAKTPAPDPEPPVVRGPHHYSGGLDEWSPGFATVLEAKQAARRAGHVTVWLGIAEPRSVDPLTIGIEILETMGYRLGLPQAERAAIGAAVIETVAARCGPPVAMAVTSLVDFSRDCPQNLDEIGTAAQQGDYDGGEALLAADLVRVTGHPLARVNQVIATQEGDIEKILALFAAFTDIPGEPAGPSPG